MNIGIDIRPLMSPLRTGVGEYTFELVNAVFELDKTNQYFLFYNSRQDVEKYLPGWSADNIRHIHTAWPNKVFNSSIKLFGRPKLDQLIGQPLDWFYSPNINFTSLSPKTRHLITIHDLSFEFFPEFFTRKRQWWHKIINPKKQCRQAEKIIAPSENTKRDLIDKYDLPAEKIFVLYPGISPAFLNTQKENLEKEKELIRKKYFLPERFILFLGTIEPRKNIHGLIEAFEKIYPALPVPHSLIIAGAKGWKNHNLFQRAAGAPYKDRIKFIGYINPSDKPALYAAASLFVYPSFYEGFGFPVLEAMAMGVPVVTSNRSSLSEIAGSAATLINPNQISGLAKTIKNLLTDHPQRERQIKNGRELAVKFSWKKTAREWLQLLS